MDKEKEMTIAYYHDVYETISFENLKDSLKGKIALITGCSRGIGKSIAISFASAGASICVSARSEKEISEVSKYCNEKYNIKCISVVADVTNKNDLINLVKTTENELGYIDIIVNNAGLNVINYFKDCKEDSFWDIMETNVKGPMLLTRLVLPSMIKRRTGYIINISSVSGVVATPFHSVYSASKAALNHFTTCLDLEINKHGVYSFAIHPGGVKTDIVHTNEDVDNENVKKYMNFSDQLLTDTPELSAQICVYLSTGKANKLSGKYIDCTNDISTLIENIDVINKKNLYVMTTNELTPRHEYTKLSEIIKGFVQ